MYGDNVYNYPVEPSYEMLMNSAPSEAMVMEQLQAAQQHNDPIKKNTLLAAGLGAGAGGLMTGIPLHGEGAQKHQERISNALRKFVANNQMDKLYKDSTSTLHRLFQPVDAKLSGQKFQKLYDRAKAFQNIYLQPEAVSKAGWNNIMRNKGKLAAGAAAGGLLGLLANKVLSKMQEENQPQLEM